VVWRFSKLEAILVASDFALSSDFIRKDLQNGVEPMGQPKTHSPFVTSLGFQLVHESTTRWLIVGLILF
jgi:hypothetical protein